ncbi:MAG: response regulator [Burkholderiales bacterium]|jgi:excisionase family DNA binding protein|nr:response regulator [Burkholderiales bacterium]
MGDANDFADSQGPVPGETYCGTTYAARLLDASVGTVQQLVERGELSAWKTKGGHRRVSLSSIEQYLKRTGGSSPSVAAPDKPLRVLIVEDGKAEQILYRESIEDWGLPIDVTILASPLEAMLDIGTLEPKVLVTDIDLPVLNGLEMVRTIRNTSNFDQMHVIIITGLSAEVIEERGGIPEGAFLLGKPIDFSWLHGFLSALTNEQWISRHSNGAR